MDLFIDRDELTRALGRAQGIAEKRTTSNALSHVLLSARGDRLRTTATDTLLTLVSDHPARIEADGEIGVEAAHFFQVARSLPTQTVRLRIEGPLRLEVTSGPAEFQLVGLSAEEFPPPPARDEGPELVVSAADLRRIIDETAFAICADDNRYGLNGAHLEEVEGEDGEPRVRMVATDGSRLSWSETRFMGEFRMNRQMLLPRKGMLELRKLTEQQETPWSVSFGDRSATFATEGTTLMMRLVEGAFPDYRKVIPATSQHRITLPGPEFIDELRRVMLMAVDRNHSVRFRFESDRLVLLAENIDRGAARTELPAELEGEEFSTAFNARYFLDFVSVVKPERLLIQMEQPLDPCVVRVADRDDCLYVIMPMRLD